MQNRKNKNIIIGTLCAVIVGLVVGYAALSQILNINGTSMISGDFKIQFTKIDENTMVNATTASKGGIGTTTATFTVDLEKPGSSALYDLTVENKGSIDAVLKSIEGLDESNLSEPLDIKFSLIGIEEGDPLNAGASKSFQVKVVWDSNATSVPSNNKTLTLKLNYEQKTGNSGGSGNTQFASDYLINNNLESDVLSGGNGLVALDNTGEITTSTSPREYRYIGSNPDNYVRFNNELWRIIGIFDGQLKITRANKLDTDMGWDSNAINDWSQASLQTYLNGEYLNGIDVISQGYISDYTWKLGGVRSLSNKLTQNFYEEERGTDRYDETRLLEWTGKIALIYPSDYGFSTSGGSTTNRSSCLAKELNTWYSVSDCNANSWLSTSSNYQWTMTLYIGHSQSAFQVNDSSIGGVSESYGLNNSYAVRPTLYLNSTVKIVGGTGADTDPFILDQ